MGASYDQEHLCRVVEEIITPFVGSFMARSSTELHCQKLGLDGTVSEAQAEAFVERLAKAMRVLVGNAKTEELVAEIHDRLSAGGGA